MGESHLFTDRLHAVGSLLLLLCRDMRRIVGAQAEGGHPDARAHTRPHLHFCVAMAPLLPHYHSHTLVGTTLFYEIAQYSNSPPRGLSIPTRDNDIPSKFASCHAHIHHDALVSHMETTF